MNPIIKKTTTPLLPAHGKEKPVGDPVLGYPPSDDIYRKSKEQPDIDPEDVYITKTENPDEKYGRNNMKDFNEDHSGSDLDIPDSDMDDNDEENDGYSLGGDEHNDLEEDRGV